MGTSLVKSSKNEKSYKASVRTEEPKVTRVTVQAFLNGVQEIQPIHVKNYVCLF